MHTKGPTFHQTNPVGTRRYPIAEDPTSGPETASHLHRPNDVDPTDWSLVEEAGRATHSTGTHSVYDSHWRQWQSWCAERGYTDLPASPEHLITYLSESAENKAMSTVRTAAAAIRRHHIQADLPNPAAHPDVVTKLRGLGRKHRQSPKQVEGITSIRMAAIAVTALLPRGRETTATAQLRGITDLAIIAVMRDALLRRAEAAELTWNDLEEAEDGSGRLYIAYSKTDQLGEGATAFISPQTMRWLRSMRELAPNRQAIFGICSVQIARRIASAAAAARLSGRYGGHSPRIGMTLDLAEAGVELYNLMQVGRWKTSHMPARYIRKMAAARNAVANWYAQRG